MRELWARRKNLAAQSWLWLTGFSVCMLAVLWVLQFALFNSFYYSLRKVELRRTGREIVALYEDRNFVGTDLIMRQQALERNLRIMLIDNEGVILLNFDGFGTLFDLAGGRLAFGPDEAKEIAKRFDSNGRDMCYISRDEGRAIYIGRVEAGLSGERFLYVGSPIPPADATLSVMTMQFLLVTIVLLLFSAVAAWLLSRRISRPILRLTESAKGLAKGEFQANPGKRDYTEIVQLQEELSHATQELTKAERYRRELLANVSHDLKTPLTIIKFYAEMLRDISGVDPEKREVHCEKIIEESDRLTGMVNELLEVSKLEQLEDIAMGQVRLDLILHEVAGRFEGMQEKYGLQFVLEIEENSIVQGNAELLGRAGYNLIANAVNHIGEDKTVIVRLCTANGCANGCARVEIEDHGEGIPAEELEHVWERYYKSREHHQRGSGLGLSIVQTALRLHGARYGAESEEGKGSLFWFEMEKG